MKTILALLGFAPTETQANTPPLLAYLAVLVVGYFSAAVLEAVVWVVARTGVTGHYLSVGLRTVGVVAVLILAQGAYRAVVYKDSHSWAGYVRNLLQK